MPLGSKVFVRAQLCNTNEVFIRYDDIFTKQTAYEALDVCERNIKRCNGMIENLEKEKKLLSNNLFARQEVITNNTFDTTQQNTSNIEPLVDLNEPYDEETEAAWREQHKQKLKEHKQKLAEERKKFEEQERILLTKYKLNNIDKIPRNSKKCKRRETHLDEIDSDDYSSNESCDDDYIDDEEYEEEEMVDQDDDDDDVDDDDDDDDDEDEDDEDSKLEIVFTNDIPETTSLFSKNTKKKVSFNNEVEIKEFVPRPEEHFIRRKEETETQILVTEIDDIVEKISDTCINNETKNDEENPRPISKFKANRNKNNIK